MFTVSPPVDLCCFVRITEPTLIFLECNNEIETIVFPQPLAQLISIPLSQQPTIWYAPITPTITSLNRYTTNQSMWQHERAGLAPFEPNSMHETSCFSYQIFRAGQ